MTRSMGWLVIVAGICAIIIGILILAGGLSWFGRLPGDIRIETGRTRLYIPLTSMLLISLAISLIVYLVRRFF
jgi:membrane protein implicated in regulation of membrane protease activity